MEIIGVVIVLMGFAGLPSYLQQRKYGAFADAIVTKIEKGTSKYKARTYYHKIVHVIFYTEVGEQITSNFSKKENSYKIGDAVRILYLRNNPKKIYLKSEKTSILPFLSTIIIGLILSVVGFVYFK